MSISFAEPSFSVIMMTGSFCCGRYYHGKAGSDMKKILVIGSVNMDLVIRTERLPQKGETIRGNGFSTIPGGKGANQAIAAARLGCQVDMIAAVGNDIYGRQLLENLQKNHVGTNGVSMVDTNSGIAVITVCDGDNSIILDKGANGTVSFEMIESSRRLLEESDIVVMQFEIPLDTVVRTARLAREMGKFVILNPAPAVDFPPELYACADIMIPNETEAEQILGMKLEDMEDAKAAVLRLHQLGVKHPVITLGVQGCVYVEDGIARHLPACVVKAVDSTGAGDSFIGGICKGFSDGKTLTESLIYARAVSAITVGRFGATPAFPYHEEVIRFIEDYKTK